MKIDLEKCLCENCAMLTTYKSCKCVECENIFDCDKQICKYEEKTIQRMEESYKM